MNRRQPSGPVVGGGHPAPPPARPRVAFALLATVQVMLLMAMMVIAVALPIIQQDLDLSRTRLALVNSAYPVSFCGLLLLGGRIGDVFGHRRTFMAGMVIFAVGSAVTGLAPGFVELLLARFGQGVGAALATPTAMGLLGAVFTDRREHTHAVALWGGLPIIGGAVGLLLSGPIASWASWRWAFLVPVVISLVALVLAPRLLPGTRPSRKQRVDLPGAILVTAGLTATCFGLEDAGGNGASVTALGTIGLGVLLLVGFVAFEARTANPLLPVSFIAAPRRLTALIGIASAAAGVFTLSFFLPLYLHQTHGFTPVETSAAYLPYALTMFVASSLSGRIVARIGPRVSTVTGFLVGATGLFLLSGMDGAQTYFGTILAGIIVFPIGAVLVFSGTTVVAMEDVPETHSGVAGGLLNAAIELGPTLGFASLVSIAATWSSGLTADGLSPAEAVPAGYAAALRIAAVGYLVIAALSLLSFWRRARRRRRADGGAGHREQVLVRQDG